MNGLFGGGNNYALPAPEPLPEPTPAPDINSQVVEQARKQKISKSRQRSGRVSTVLTKQPGQGLGG